MIGVDGPVRVSAEIFTVVSAGDEMGDIAS